MYLVRPCALEDVSSIESLVRENHARLSSLPRKRERLIERIEQSIRSFQRADDIQDGPFFLFVLEDTQTGQILGCSGIAMNTEPKRPFYNYRLGEIIHASERFDIHTPVSVLHLTHELTGKNTLCAFGIGKQHLNTKLFELISRARLMFMRQFPEHFSDQLVVELQGYYNEEGHSAFWDCLGRNFFEMDFASAGYHVATKSRTLLAELMPPHPIYVSLLSEEAQGVIGKCDTSANEAYDMLKKEGFQDSPFVDIFDAGPVLLADKERTETFVSSKRKTVRAGNVSTGTYFMVANDSFENFSVAMAQLTDGLGEVLRVDESVMKALNLKDGEDYYFAPLNEN